MRIVLPILLGTLLVVLWWFNPQEEQFTDFLTQEIRVLTAEAGADVGGALGGVTGVLTRRLGYAAGDAIGNAAGREASGRFERKSYGVASMYTLDLNGRRPEGEWKFLGIAGQFVPIEQPENLEQLIRDQLAR